MLQCAALRSTNYFGEIRVDVGNNFDNNNIVTAWFGYCLLYMKKVTAIPLDLGLEEKDGTRLKFIHGAIANGAMAFLKQEYKFLTIFMVVFAAIIAILIDDSHTTDIREGIYTALAFLFGGAISIASGYIGMKVATQGNARTTVSAKKDISQAFDVAINSGAVMGFALVG